MSDVVPLLCGTLLLASTSNQPAPPRVGDRVTVVSHVGSGGATVGKDYLYTRFYWMCLKNRAYGDIERLKAERRVADVPGGAPAEVLDIDLVRDRRSSQPDLLQVKLVDGPKRGATFWIARASVEVSGNRTRRLAIHMPVPARLEETLQSGPPVAKTDAPHDRRPIDSPTGEVVRVTVQGLLVTLGSYSVICVIGGPRYRSNRLRTRRL